MTRLRSELKWALSDHKVHLSTQAPALVFNIYGDTSNSAEVVFMSPWYYLKTRTFREIDRIDLGYIVGRSIPAHFMGKFLCRQSCPLLNQAGPSRRQAPSWYIPANSAPCNWEYWYPSDHCLTVRWCRLFFSVSSRGDSRWGARVVRLVRRPHSMTCAAGRCLASYMCELWYARQSICSSYDEALG